MGPHSAAADPAEQTDKTDQRLVMVSQQGVQGSPAKLSVNEFSINFFDFDFWRN